MSSILEGAIFGLLLGRVMPKTWLGIVLTILITACVTVWDGSYDLQLAYSKLDPYFKKKKR